MNSKICFLLFFAGLICCVVAQREELECGLKAIIANAKLERYARQAECLVENGRRSINESIGKTCELYNGEKEIRVFDYTTKLMLNYSSQQPPPYFVKLLRNDMIGLCKDISTNMRELGTRKRFYNQTEVCEGLNEQFLKDICMFKEVCPKNEDIQALEAFEAFIQAYLQFMFNKGGEEFSCPDFNIKINPALYQVKGGDQFNENLLAKDLNCTDVKRKMRDAGEWYLKLPRL